MQRVAALSLFCAVLCGQTALISAEEFSPVDLRHVKVGGEIGRRIDNTIYKNLMVIDIDRDFLAPLKTKQDREFYIGLGKLIDAAVKLAAYSGDEKVVARKRRLVDAAIAAQEPDGYLGYFDPPARMKTLWDIHEMSYLVQALTCDYRYFGEKRSLEAARKIADYMIAHWKDIPADWPKHIAITTDMGCIAMELAMLALTRQTNDMRYRDFCVNHRGLAKWNQNIVIGRRPLVEGHSYAFLSHCLAQWELSDLQDKQDPALVLQSRKAWDFMTRGEGMTISGGCGQWECWTDDQDGRGALGETCSTAYQLRLMDRVQRLGPRSSHPADLMERMIYNALFAAQSPDGRQIRYYTPFEGPRCYFGQDNYCCPGNFRRIIGELPSMIYYHAAGAVMVNLYTPSTAKDIALSPSDKSLLLTLEQESDYPNSGRVSLLVNPSKESSFSLHLRIPGWCPRASISINGVAHEGPCNPGTYASVTRRWKPGDRVQLNLEMPWRFVLGRQRQAGRVAVMRGPVLFGVNPLRKENLPHKDVDGVDLGRMTLVPETIEGQLPIDDIRPGGQACRIKAFTPGCNVTQPDTEFYLTEFPDVDCRAVYFRLHDLSRGVKDELLGPSAPRDEF